MLKKPRGPLPHQFAKDSQLIESCQRLNDMLLAFHVVVDRKFHQLANGNPDGAIQFVDEVTIGLKAIYRHPEFRPKAWKANATTKEKADASEAWKKTFEALWSETSKVSNTSAAEAETVAPAVSASAAGSTYQNPDCSPLCEDNGVCVPCDQSGS